MTAREGLWQVGLKILYKEHVQWEHKFGDLVGAGCPLGGGVKVRRK